MAKAKLLHIKSALTRERRTNRRLRTLLNQLNDQVQDNRRELNTQLVRLAQLQAEIDMLKTPGKK